MYKATIVLALVAAVSAGNVAYLDHHIGSAAEQTVRGFGGISSISHQARAVDSAFSTSSAYKTKVTNNAVLPAFAPAYAAPVAHAVAAPAYAAPVAHAVAAPAYAAPVAHAIATPAYAAPVAHAVAAPVLRAPLAKAVAPAGLLGVAYSPVVPGVATLNFDGFGVHYGY